MNEIETASVMGSTRGLRLSQGISRLVLVLGVSLGAFVVTSDAEGFTLNPTGGLPRRKTVLSSLGSGPTLQLEAGNALFRGMGEQDAAAKARASFILEALTALGVKALSPGVRDLGAGTAFLLCCLSTVYPAWRAATTDPARAVRHE